MKKKRIISLLLCLVLAVGLLPAVAYGAGSIVINSVSFEPYEDSYGGRNDELVMVTVSFDAPESMAQMSILLAGADIKTITAANKHQVVYQNQIITPEEGEFSFPVEKSRIASAAGLTNPVGATLYLKLSGTGTGTTSLTVKYTEPQSTYGDLNGDGYIDVVDALMILRYYTGHDTLTIAQLEAADVVKNGTVDLGDAVRILRYEAGLEKVLVTEQN